MACDHYMYKIGIQRKLLKYLSSEMSATIRDQELQLGRQ